MRTRHTIIASLVALSVTGISATFARSGTGDTVFDVPTSVSRVRVQGMYGGACQNFALKITGRLVVNTILGSCPDASGRSFDGTYTTKGGVAEVVKSAGVKWTVTEVQ